jgi:hypothetical protein
MLEHQPSCTFNPRTDLLLNGGRILARAGVLTCTCSPAFLDAQTAKRRAARKALDSGS